MGRRRHRYRVSLEPEVVDRLSYIDSVAVWRSELPTPEQYSELIDCLDCGPTSRRVRPEQVERPDWVGGFHLKYWVHQPTRAALDFLQLLAPEDLCAVHIALDLRVADADSAATLRAHIERRLIKNLTPARLSHSEEETRYIGSTSNHWTNPLTEESGISISRRGSGIALYSNKPSKVEPAVPCVHVEYRVEGTEEVRRQLLSWDDLRALDHCEFWDERLRLLRPPPFEHLVRAAAERIFRFQKNTSGLPRASRKDRLEMAEESLLELFAVHAVHYETAPASDILYVLQQPERMVKQPAKYFASERHDWLLPTTCENAFWAGHSISGSRR
jgi:hypothetical protein